MIITVTLRQDNKRTVWQLLSRFQRDAIFNSLFTTLYIKESRIVIYIRVNDKISWFTALRQIINIIFKLLCIVHVSL